jgi:hypothetical protein
MKSEHDRASEGPRFTRRRVLGALGIGAIAATGGIAWSRREATIPVDPMTASGQRRPSSVRPKTKSSG